MAGASEDTIWQFEQEYLDYVRTGFANVLRVLKCTLTHEIYLLGFVLDETDETEPNTFPLLLPNNHKLPLDLLGQEFDGRKFNYSQPPDGTELGYLDQQIALAAYEGSCWRIHEGILEVLKGEPSLNHWMMFCSRPRHIENCLASVVVLVNRKQYDAQPHLDEEVSYQERGLWPSFLFAIIEVFLEQYSPDMGHREGLLILKQKDPKELLRAAGARFTHTAANAGKPIDPQDREMYGEFDLFETCNVISSMNYEGAEGVGDLIIADKDIWQLMFRSSLLNQWIRLSIARFESCLRCAKEKHAAFTTNSFGFSMEGARYTALGS